MTESPDITSVLLIEFTCEFCGEKQTTPGALIFGPPNERSQCAKWHICDDCYGKIGTDILDTHLSKTPGHTPVPDAAGLESRDDSVSPDWFNAVLRALEQRHYPSSPWWRLRRAIGGSWRGIIHGIASGHYRQTKGKTPPHGRGIEDGECLSR